MTFVLLSKIKKLLRILLSPVRGELPHLAYLMLIQLLLPLLWLLFFAPDMGAEWRLFRCYKVFTLCVVITYAYAWLRHVVVYPTFRSLLRRIFLFLLILCQWVSLLSMAFTESAFHEDTVSILFNTNSNEFVEFLSAYFSLHVLGVLVLSLLVLVGLYRVCKAFLRRVVPSSQPHWILALLLVGCIVDSNVVTDKYARQLTVYGMVRVLTDYSPVTEISPTNPQLDLSAQEDVPLVMVVIGESLSRSHCSLYQYDKPTNPRLGALPDSLLHVFTSVEAPATHTVQAFSRFMTLADTVDIPRCYQLPNLIEIAKRANYQTVWISNQSEKGIFDSAVTIFAHLCDSTLWNGNRFSGVNHKSLDGELVPMVASYPVDNHQMMFVHLMGNHEQFAKRFPSSFRRFSPADYSSAPAHQRQTLADYDNCVLYNDDVVARLMDTCKDRDAVVLYFPDHGLDVYETNPRYCGHAIDANATSDHQGRQIPFLIYTSSLYRTLHPDHTRMIEQARHRSLNTADLPYMLMQLMGITFTDRANKFPFGAPEGD